VGVKDWDSRTKDCVAADETGVVSIPPSPTEPLSAARECTAPGCLAVVLVVVDALGVNTRLSSN